MLYLAFLLIVDNLKQNDMIISPYSFRMFLFQKLSDMITLKIVDQVFLDIIELHKHHHHPQHIERNLLYILKTDHFRVALM